MVQDGDTVTQTSIENQSNDAKQPYQFKGVLFLGAPIEKNIAYA